MVGVVRNSLMGRDKLREKIRAAVQPGAGGVMLVGEAGVGKTTLAEQALVELGTEVHIERIRGSAVTSRTPYGALGFLLSGVDDVVLQHPALVLEAIANVLMASAMGRPVIIFADHADELDPLTVMAVTQLSRGGSIGLLAATTDPAAGGGEFTQLHVDGRIQMLKVEPLSLDDSGRLLQGLLGGSLSALAVRTLTEAAGGNPLYLQMLAKDQVAEGSLVQVDEIWAMTKSPIFLGSVVDIMRAHLQRLRPEHRRIVEIIGSIGTLPGGLLKRVADSVDIDFLEERRMVEFASTSSLTVQLCDGFLSKVIRDGLPAGRSRDLWEEVTAEIALPDVPEDSLPGFIDWGLRCGAVLKPEDLLNAAQVANGQCNPESALRAVKAVTGYRSDPAALLEAVRAHIGLGELAEASEALHPAQDVFDAASLEVWVFLMMEKAKILRILSNGGGEIELAAIQRVLREEIPRTDLRWQALSDEVVLAKADQVAYQGRYSSIPENVLDIYLDPDRSVDVRTRAGSGLCEAWAMTGRQRDAIKIGHTLLEDMFSPGVMKATREVAYSRVVNAFLTSGLLTECLDLLDRADEEEWSMLSDAAGGELVRGLAHAYAGCSDRALQSLLPAISQLELRDPDGWQPAAHAAAAYAYNLQADTTKVQHHLQLAETGKRSSPWHVGRARELFALMATADEEMERDAVCDLRALADDDVANGNVSHALHFLSAAARRHGYSSGARLVELASKSDGSYAELCAQFGTGLTHESGPILIRSAELAVALGQTLFGHEAALEAGREAAHAGDRATMRDARRLENSAFRQLRYCHSFAGRLELLNPFEADLAHRTVRGDSSAALAKQLNLSSRTIDWHLGKLFETLHVSGRPELRELLG